jgi:hypothetical protein
MEPGVCQSRRYVFSTRMRTSFQINVHAPLLIIPEAGQEKGSTLLVSVSGSKGFCIDLVFEKNLIKVEDLSKILA